MPAPDDLPILTLPDPESWAQWLEANHETSGGVWLMIAKKGAPEPTPTYAQALEEALRYGWIDGQKGRHDNLYWLQRFTPRGPRSVWSKINREKAEQLIAAGRMAPAGLAAVEAARASGRWDAAYEPQSKATIPDDFARELERAPEARAFFETLTGAKRYAFLYRLHQVKRPETRARRISQYIELLSAGRTLQD